MKPQFILPILAILTVISYQIQAGSHPLSDVEADALVSAQVAARAEREAARPINQVDLHVLQQREVERADGRRLILNRVAPPDLPDVTSIPTADTRIDFTDDELVIAEEYELTDWELRYLKRTDFKTNIVLSFSVTIYGGEITRMQWAHEGTLFTVYSNIDFNYLRGVRGGSDPDGEYYYTLNMGIGEADLDEIGDVFYRLPVFHSGRADYYVDSGTSGLYSDDDVFAPLDVLHQWYSENEAQLKIQHQRREALNAAWKRYHKANPPEQQDTLINFWPTRS